MVLGHRRHSAASSRASQDGGSEYVTDDETVVDAEQGNVLMHIISQLRPGADLSRVTLPTFILEPRSMLERITNFMAHPEMLLPIPKIKDPVERFVAVTKFYMSGWHIKPPGVKKPMNPILGEIFTGWWDYPDGTKGYYISEQTSHHPPKSSYFFIVPEHGIRADGTLKPRSKFLGNSAASMMEGIAIMRLTDWNERYFITQPNMYARGILFGKMKYELGDHAFIRCPESGLEADLEFKTKGYFGGAYNAIGGFIKDKSGKNLYELSGHWNGEMFIKNLSKNKKDVLFDATHAKETPPFARPIQEQEERESQRLWKDVNIAIKNRDHQGATDHKSKIEDMQRQEAAKRAEDGVEWRPRLFRAVQGGPGGSEEGEEDLDWILNAKIDSSLPPTEITKQVLNVAAILPGQKPSSQIDIPPRTNGSADNLSRHDSQPVERPHQVSASAAVGGAQGDLIDFGEGGEPTPTITSTQAAVPLGESRTGTIPESAKIEPPGWEAPNLLKNKPRGKEEKEMAGLTDGVKDMHVHPKGTHGADTPPMSPGIRRMDSQTGDHDEFVDAES